MHLALVPPKRLRHRWLATLAGLAGLTATAPAQTAADSVSSQENYRLRHGDLVVFSVFQEPELRTEARVQADGTITLPLVHVVKAERMTLEELRLHLTELFDRDFLVSPQITLRIAEYTRSGVQVIGQVNRPGPIAFPAEQPMHLLEAIGVAGGFTRRADARKVSIRRIIDGGTQDIIEIDVGELLSDPRKNDIELHDGDTILVGERWI